MYQDMDFFLRPIIEDLEKHVGEAQRSGDCIQTHEGGGLPRLEVIDSEVGGCEGFETGAGAKEVR
jgi:hypothetical protein